MFQNDVKKVNEIKCFKTIWLNKKDRTIKPKLIKTNVSKWLEWKYKTNEIKYFRITWSKQN